MTEARQKRSGVIVVAANSSWNIINFRSGLIRGLIALGYRIVVIAPFDEYSPRIADLGAEYRQIGLSSSGLSPFGDGRSLITYYRMLRALRPDAFLGFTPKPNIYGTIAAHALGIRAVNNISGLGTAFMKRGALQSLVSLLYRLALSRSATVFFQNSDDCDLFVGRKLVRKNQVSVLRGSGIDLEYFAPRAPRVEDGEIFFLLVGRMLRDKGVVEFVDAARILLGEGRKMRFGLLGPAGTENPTAISAAQLAGWHAEGVIEFLGEADDVRSHLALADCVVLPSYREGLPRSLIEAAAMARPVITTDVPGCRAAVVPGRTGLMCAARSSASLADAMRRFADISPAARVAMGARGRDKALQEYGQAHITAAYARALE